MRRPSGGEASGRPAVLHALRLELSMRRASDGEAIGRPSRTDVDHHAVVTLAMRVALRQRRRRLRDLMPIITPPWLWRGVWCSDSAAAAD